MKFSTGAHDRDWWLTPQADRDAICEWMDSNGIRSTITRDITLGEGHVVATQDVTDDEDRRLIVDDEVVTVQRTYPVKTLPPVWLKPTTEETDR